MTDQKSAMTMREIREGLGHVTPGVPEPTVLPTAYVVSCLPLGHDERWEYTINVRHQQGGLYAVQHGLSYWGTDGRWSLQPGGISEDDEPDDPATVEWEAAHRFDNETALRLAVVQAPRLTYRGRTVADALAAPAP
jgi:hypothetical protein